MKHENTLFGSEFDGQFTHIFAEYLAKYVSAYESAGVHIDFISTQNDPQVPSDQYPSMKMNVNDQASLVIALRQKLDEDQLFDTKVGTIFFL